MMKEHPPEKEMSQEDKANVAETVPFLFLQEAGAYLDTILPLLNEDRPDAVIHDFAALAGTIAADALNLVNIMIFPTYPSNDSFSIAGYFEDRIKDHPMIQAADQLADLYVEKYGCRKLTVREIFDGHGEFNVVLIQKRFLPEADRFDNTYVFTGAQIGERPSFGSWKAKEDDRPLVYSSFGTTFTNWPEYYPILFEAVRDLDLHVVASLGEVDPASLSDIPKNTELVPMVSQLDILSRTSVFITHAGMGSGGEAIYYGVPMIALPQMEEQVLTARLIEQNGLGISFPEKNKLTADDLKAAIVRILKDPSYRRKAEEFRDDMNSLGGAKAAVDAIMNYIRDSKA